MCLLKERKYFPEYLLKDVGEKLFGTMFKKGKRASRYLIGYLSSLPNKFCYGLGMVSPNLALSPKPYCELFALSPHLEAQKAKIVG